ncbi:MAG: hypothetical protein AB4426_26720 [Xenococcaceae cyanobacterium]
MILQLNSRSLIALMVALSAAPAIAEVANFEPLTLALGFNREKAVVTGHTGGSYSLSSIANSDRHNKPCIGYGDPHPDHIMILENDFPRLKLQVDSGGEDTTLVVRRSNESTIRCDFGTTDNKDASIEDTNWKAGRYEIWVGSIEAGQRWNYRLSAQQ